MQPVDRSGIDADGRGGVTIGKKHTDTQTQSTYQYYSPPTDSKSAQYLDQAKTLADSYDGGAAAAREAAARNVNAISNTGNDIFGADTTPEQADKVKASRLFRNNMDLGQNLESANQNAIGFKNSAYMSLGGMTAPQLVQTGGTGSSQMYGGQLGEFGNSFASGAGTALAA